MVLREAVAEQSQGGNCLYEHHHGYDERAEARA